MNTTRETLLEAFKDVKFQEQGHKYWFENKPNKKLLSVTTLVGQLHKPFDQDSAAERTAKKWGTTKEEVLQTWKNDSIIACDKGTLTHSYMEHILSKQPFDIPKNLNRPEITTLFDSLKPVCDNFLNTELANLTPICSELPVGVYDWSLVGTIDQIFQDENGDLYIYDWKTNKKFTEENSWENLLAPFETYPDSNFHAYSIQLRLYQRIIEHVTGLKVKGCRLVWFSPTGHKLYNCLEYSGEIDQLLQNHINKYGTPKKEEFEWVHISA